jgi:uncharacterized protein YceH (UPF0502 family)
MTVEEPEVDDALERLKRRSLVYHITGGRAERWRHNLYEAWKVNKPELALLAELLLRGPQTAAEARSRASRMEPLDAELATTVIKGLAERGMVVWLEPEHRRGAQLTHGFHTADELARLKGGRPVATVEEPPASPMPTPTSSPVPVTPLEARLKEALGEIARLRTEVESLRAAVVGLQQALGVTPTPNA